MQVSEYISMNTLRDVLDIALVFVLVYVLLKLLRGTRAVPTVIGLVLLGLLYWLASTQELPTLEFVLRYAVVYVGFAIIVLFQNAYGPCPEPRDTAAASTPVPINRISPT